MGITADFDLHGMHSYIAQNIILRGAGRGTRHDVENCDNKISDRPSQCEKAKRKQWKTVSDTGCAGCVFQTCR